MKRLRSAAWSGNLRDDKNAFVLANDDLPCVSPFARAVGGSLDHRHLRRPRAMGGIAMAPTPFEKHNQSNSSISQKNSSTLTTPTLAGASDLHRTHQNPRRHPIPGQLLTRSPSCLLTARRISAEPASSTSRIARDKASPPTIAANIKTARSYPCSAPTASRLSPASA
jgi:hypothetical protein